uniref:Uncharacterized protein n=1 Tax=Erpetoichthys calabaricus TaxID=27687 RepID=A0A8C4SIS2_ERPCA
MSSNFLKLNKEKTEILVIGNNGYNEVIRNKLDALGLKVKREVKNLGVTIDYNLNFKSHINLITRTAFFQLRNITKVRPLISFKDAEKLVHTFVFSRLDYCNTLLSGLPKKDINRLQLVQNAATRILTRKRKSKHISPYLNTYTGILLLRCRKARYCLPWSVLAFIHQLGKKESCAITCIHVGGTIRMQQLLLMLLACKSDVECTAVQEAVRSCSLKELQEDMVSDGEEDSSY